MSYVTFTFLCAATLCVAIHTSAAAQGPSTPPQGGVVPRVGVATSHPVAVRTATAQSQPVETADEDNDVSEVDTTPDLRFDLRVVSMRGPILESTKGGTPRQIIMVTVANFGHDSTPAARLSLAEDTHGRPLSQTALPIPSLAPGGTVTIPMPVTVPDNLAGQVCFTGSIELP